MKHAAVLVLLAACTSIDVPAPPPPAAAPAPPWGVPISGGTLIVSHDGTHAIVSDPDRDQIAIVSLPVGDVTLIPLQPGDEPGRLVEDSAGRVHVALRRGGALVSVDAAGNLLYRRSVCAEPRGVAYDATADVVHVACTSGELVTFPAAGGAELRRVTVADDLRDVIVTPAGLRVTRFRSAQILALDANGDVTATYSPPDVQRVDASDDPVPGTAETAWRTIALNDGTLLMSHQRQIDATLGSTTHSIVSGNYYATNTTATCGNPSVESSLTALTPDGTIRAVASIAAGSLPVDLAASADGTTLAVAVAGASAVGVAPTTAVLNGSDQPPCSDDGFTQLPTTTTIAVSLSAFSEPPSSVAFDASNDLFVYYPQPAAIAVYWQNGDTSVLPVQEAPGDGTGRALFEDETPIGLSCESCHPEGRDDGRTWHFAGEGARRTQSIAGHVMERAPYHWQGDLPDMPALAKVVFTERMGGAAVSPADALALGAWLEGVPPPAPPPVSDAASVARGQALFESAETGCTTCHSGPLLTNKAIVNVGTGGAFKVPSLIGVGARPPYLHDGCAPTLADRFGACGGGDQHGHTSQLDAQNIADVVAYLETL